MNRNTYIIIDLVLKKVAAIHDIAKGIDEKALCFLIECLRESNHVFAKLRFTNDFTPLQEVVFKEVFVE